jgi:hypothetical protein
MKVLSDGTRVQFNLRTTGVELYAQRISLLHRYELECVSCLGYECSRCKRCFTDTELRLAASRGEEALRRDILAGRCFSTAPGAIRGERIRPDPCRCAKS